MCSSLTLENKTGNGQTNGQTDTLITMDEASIRQKKLHWEAIDSKTRECFSVHNSVLCRTCRQFMSSSYSEQWELPCADFLQHRSQRNSCSWMRRQQPVVSRSDPVYLHHRSSTLVVLLPDHNNKASADWFFTSVICTCWSFSIEETLVGIDAVVFSLLRNTRHTINMMSATKPEVHNVSQRH